MAERKVVATWLDEVEATVPTVRPPRRSSVPSARCLTVRPSTHESDSLTDWLCIRPTIRPTIRPSSAQLVVRPTADGLVCAPVVWMDGVVVVDSLL